MTISGTLECSTCGHKLRIRYQAGYIFPFPVKIACNQCGKLIKGHIRSSDSVFDFPNDKVSKDYVETTQVVSISSELPIPLKLSNIPSMTALTPFIAMTTILGHESLMFFQVHLKMFIDVYDSRFSRFVTISELFSEKNWQYFLEESKKHFRPNLSLDIRNFEDCCLVLTQINGDFFKHISSEHYEVNYKQKLKTNSIEKVLTKWAELKELKIKLTTYINLESEFIKGVKLIETFLDNIKSFLPVVALTYKNEPKKEWKDEIGITTFEFLDLKEMYIEQFEYLSRISSLYFGLINLGDRNAFDDFGSIPDCGQLSDYFKKDNGIKKDIIKKLPLLDDYFGDTLNSQIRNGIGHLKTTYDAKAQLIKYFPYKDLARVNIHKEIYLIDFAIQVYEQALRVRDSLEILAIFLARTK